MATVCTSRLLVRATRCRSSTRRSSSCTSRRRSGRSRDRPSPSTTTAGSRSGRRRPALWAIAAVCGEPVDWLKIAHLVAQDRLVLLQVRRRRRSRCPDDELDLAAGDAAVVVDDSQYTSWAVDDLVTSGAKAPDRSASMPIVIVSSVTPMSVAISAGNVRGASVPAASVPGRLRWPRLLRSPAASVPAGSVAGGSVVVADGRRRPRGASARRTQRQPAHSVVHDSPIM